MRSLNKAQLIGNIGHIQTHPLTTGKNVTHLSVATEYQSKIKEGDKEKLEKRTDWHRIICYNGLSDIASSYLQVGSRIYIEGYLRYRDFEDKDGLKRNVIEIVAKELIILSSLKAPLSDDDESVEK